jgi:hypothetical protein
MQFVAPLQYRFGGQPITHQQALLLMGSCFTAHVGEALADRMFKVLPNPTGILFDPTAIARHLHHLVEQRQFNAQDVFEQDGVWHSWDHHSDFSALEAGQALRQINEAIAAGHDFLRESSWLVLTLGSAFRYLRADSGRPVANNHRAPAQGFRKELLRVSEISTALALAIQAARSLNPGLQVLLTVSPVRHLRDGMIENNRSKARLLEAVHRLCEELPHCHYFPAYEYVIDVLRDYRWYDVDLAHPNHAATQYVFEQFCQACMPESTRQLSEKAYRFSLAARHRPRFPESAAHQQFLEQQAAGLAALLREHPELQASTTLR